MKLYNPKGANNPQPQQVKQRSNYTYPIFNWLEGFIIGSILAPISLLLGVVTMGVLVFIAFGKVDYWGTTGRVLVGVCVPLIVILCLISKPLGNLIFTVWSFLLCCVLIFIPLLGIMYICFKPVFEYLGF